MKKTALLFFGSVLVSAVAGSVTAWGVEKYLSHETVARNRGVDVSWSGPEQQAGTHFTAYQAEQYPALTNAETLKPIARYSTEDVRTARTILSMSFSECHTAAARASLRPASSVREVRAS